MFSILVREEEQRCCVEGYSLMTLYELIVIAFMLNTIQEHGDLCVE